MSLSKGIHDITWGDRKLPFSEKTLVMGILNVTNDSFSDGGKFFDYDEALRRGLEIEEEGADVLDVGGESTRPFSEPISEEEEIRRVAPVIETLAKRIKIPISVDTTKATVAKRAIDAGASIINDISAFRTDMKLADVVAETGVPVILMHMKGTPKTMQVNPDYSDLFGEINNYFEKAVTFALSKGVERRKIILDPGIGFGKTGRHNLLIVKNVKKFHDFGMPILIGHSRKSFIRNIIKEPDQKDIAADLPIVELGNQAVTAAAALNGAHMIRVHEVKNTITTLKLIDAIRKA